MRDHLLDIVAHTHALGVINQVKIVGTDSETILEAISDDRSVVINAKFNGVIPEFIGTFGFPNLSKLNTILNIPEYREDAKFSVTMKNDVPVGVHFENKTGDFKNDFRFMSAEVVNDKIKVGKFKGAKWDVTFTPLVANALRLKYQASANSEEQFFIAKTEGQDLKFYFGDHSTHAGDFVFHTPVTGSLTASWKWPINIVLGILNLDGDKTMRFSDAGAAMITVDSGLCVYNYILPAQTK